VRVVALGIWSKGPEYPRSANLIEGLREAGIEVVECRFAMAGGFEERRRSVRGVMGPLRYALLLLASYPVLAWRFLRAPAPDAILLLHPGIFHVPLARLLRRLRARRATVALDLFYSLHEAVVADRRLLGPRSLSARALFTVERAACRGADLVITDTGANARWAEVNFGLAAGKTASLPVGPVFPPFPSPVEPPAVSPVERFTVLFVGTYIPLHGIETILGAAARLRDQEGVRFLLVGKGQLRREMEDLARATPSCPVEFRDWVPAAGLGALYRAHGVALGVFGLTAKADRVIPTKAYDACAAGVPLITADTTGAREGFRHGDNAYLVPAGDPAALAEAIIVLRRDPALRARLARGALASARGAFSLKEIGRRTAALLVERSKAC
jgi:glycosyltransferase involved in cell wall biosynthesis